MLGNYFGGLAYSLGDEDSRIEREILPDRASRVLTIAGSGGRVVPLLARTPRTLEAVDISPRQIAFTRLRLAAFAALDSEEYTRLLGYGREPLLGEPRHKLITALPLPDADRSVIVEVHRAHPETPLIYTGKFEKTLKRFSSIIRAVLGNRIRELFEITDLSEQHAFLQSRFPRKRWKLLVGLLGNATFLNAVLYRGEFPKKNLPGSHFRIYSDIFDGLFERVLARESFFLQLLMLGEVSYSQGFPVECEPATYARARSALESTKVDVRVGDITEFSKQPANDLDFLSLSDVPSFLDADSEQNILSRVAPCMSLNGRVVLRSHLRTLPPIVPPFRDITTKYSDLIATETTNLWRIAVVERC